MGFHHLDQILNSAEVSVGGGRNWDGAVMWEEFNLLCHSLGACLWYIYSVAYIVLWGRSKVPTLHFVLLKGAPFPWPLKNKDFGSGGSQKSLIKINGSV